MFFEEEGRLLEIPVTLSEVESTLRAFARDKSPGPDGWTSKFYLHFLELFVPDIVLAIEDSRRSGFIHDSLNTTFMTLILKVDSPASFVEYRPLHFVIFCTNWSQKSLLVG